MQLALFFISLATISTWLVVRGIDFLWHGNFNTEMQFATLVTPLVVGLGVVVLFIAQLETLKLEVSRCKRFESALLESDARLRSLVENAPAGILFVDLQNYRIIEANRTFLKMLDYSMAELRQMSLTDLTHPDDLDKSLQAVNDLASDKITSYRFEKRYIRKDRSVLWVDLIVDTLWENDGNSKRVVGIVTDVTEKKRTEALLRQQNEALQLATTVFDTVDEAVIVTDPDSIIISVNPAFTAITGYTAQEAIGKNPSFLSSGTHKPEFYMRLWESLATTGMWRGEVWNRHKNGELFIEWLTIKQVYDENDQLTHYVATFSDITERKAEEEHVHHLAHYDALTDLPNRSLLFDRLRQAFTKAKRDQIPGALLFLDLDKFKPVNDTLGHNIGDLVLKEAAKRLLDCVRESDTVSRIGGDEFVVLLPSVAQQEDAIVVAKKIVHALSQPFELAGHRLSLSTSIGLAIFPQANVDEKLLVKHADSAMYQAKQAGGNCFEVYQPGDSYTCFEIH